MKNRSESGIKEEMIAKKEREWRKRMNRMKRIGIWMAAALCLIGTVMAAEPAEITTHWAGTALQAAMDCGVLQGNENGELLPDAPVTGAQTITMLERVLGLTVREAEPGEAWYIPAEETARAWGILPADAAWNLSEQLTRERAFFLISNAFQLRQTDLTPLQEFSDGSGLSGDMAQAAAGLVAVHAVEGSNGALRPQAGLTRAELVTLLYRLTGFETENAIVKPCTETALRQNGETFTGGLLAASGVETISLQHVTLDGPLVVHTAALQQGRIDDTQASRLVLAQQSGAVTVSGGVYAAVQIGTGSGSVILSNVDTPVVEIFGNDREIDLRGIKLERLTICGSGNTVLLDGRSEIAQLKVQAPETTLKIQGEIGTITVAGANTAISGDGMAQQILIAAAGVENTLRAKTVQEDMGLTQVNITLDAPVVQPGGMLVATATMTGVEMEKICEAQWYLDGKAVAAFSNASYVLTENTVSRFKQDVAFSRKMPLTHTVELKLTYHNPISGETEQLAQQATVQIRNYTEAEYQKRDQALAAKVSCNYEGDFTMDYNIDYDLQTKEAFVNAGGYESKTDYLLWINRATQKVNVFTGSKQNWTLLKTYRCATGAMATPTPVGVTYVTYKQDGWYMGSYNVYWITRFYPGTGYAFHSRGYYPDERHVALWPNIGYPMSAGCIRLYDDAAKWIHDTIPLNTTVVIY